MKEEYFQSRRDLWLPALVGLVGVLIALAMWGVLVAERRGHLLASTRQAAEETRIAIELALDEQLDALRGLSEFWVSFGIQPLDEWQADADQQVDSVVGLSSVAWVDLDEPRNRIAVGRSQSPDAMEIDVDLARLHGSAPTFLGPERDEDGEFVYRVFLPVDTPQAHAGVLIAHIRVRPFLDYLLRGRALGHALSVYAGDEEIFARGQPSQDRWQRWWRVEKEVDLPLGGHWRIAYRPTAEFAAERLSPVPHYLLAAGLFLALVSAVATHLFRIILRQSTFLRAANDALESRGRELESRVADRTEKLQEAVTELEAFNYSISHDLRTPLSAILNFTAILEEDFSDRPLDDDGLEMLSRIRRSALRASTLLEDLLQLSRAGRATLKREPVDMTALAREMFAQARAAEGGVNVELDLHPLPDAVGDRTLLGEVLANLFSNALKYSRRQSDRRVEVRGRVDGDECVYEVIDNGQGFDMRFADKLFGLFERLGADENVEGTGVGLAMVARIVKRHGGRVWAEGSPGKGARFAFSVPRDPTEAA